MKLSFSLYTFPIARTLSCAFSSRPGCPVSLAEQEQKVQRGGRHGAPGKDTGVGHCWKSPQAIHGRLHICIPTPLPSLVCVIQVRTTQKEWVVFFPQSFVSWELLIHSNVNSLCRAVFRPGMVHFSFHVCHLLAYGRHKGSIKRSIISVTILSVMVKLFSRWYLPHYPNMLNHILLFNRLASFFPGSKWAFPWLDGNMVLCWHIANLLLYVMCIVVMADDTKFHLPDLFLCIASGNASVLALKWGYCIWENLRIFWNELCNRL